MDPFHTILSLNPGDLLLGRYKLIERLGRGAMGEVWKAEDQHTGRTYALKILPPEFIGSEAADKRMITEAAIGEGLSDDGIVRLYAYERDPTRGNVSFLRMQFVEGRDLEKILTAEGPQPLDRVLGWAKDLAAGIDYAHGKKVLHRDIKPSNVMIETSTGKARLLDFGIGREIRNTMSEVSQKADSSGTPAYMSPQQLMGENHPSNDIYSLAATLYHALAGRPPFTDGHIQTQILHKTAPPIPGLPAHVNAALVKGLAKEVEERPATARALVDSMTRPPTPPASPAPCPIEAPRAVPRQSEAAPVGASAPGRKPRRRSASRGWLIAVAVAIVAAGATIAVHQGNQARAAEEARQREAERHAEETRLAATRTVEEARQLEDNRQAVDQRSTAEVANTAWEKSGEYAVLSNTLNLLLSERDALTQQGIGQHHHERQKLEARIQALQEDIATKRAAFLRHDDSTDVPSSNLLISPRPVHGDYRDVDLGDGVAAKFVYIDAPGIAPNGFLMGSPTSEADRGDDEVHHRVKLTRGFWMQTTEVTQGQWQAVMGSNPSHFKNGANFPVEQVSWEDCVSFIGRLRSRGISSRLPTEAEWEFACRAGTMTPFSFGATISTDQANYDGNYTYGTSRKGIYREKTMPVGSFPANAWGLHDMHGNVWEWCRDWYDEYPNGVVTDPIENRTSSGRVLRGGSWIATPWNLRSASRDWSSPTYCNLSCGFRLTLDSE